MQGAQSAPVDLDDLQRTFFDGLYTYRIPIAMGTLLATGLLTIGAWRAGWFAAARRHRGRTAGILAIALVVGLPLAWYLASPLWIRTELVEPGPAVGLDRADVVASRATGPSTGPSDPPAATEVPAIATPSPFAVRRVWTGSFRGTDAFHFGRGRASIIETAPGAYSLR